MRIVSRFLPRLLLHCLPPPSPLTPALTPRHCAPLVLSCDFPSSASSCPALFLPFSPYPHPVPLTLPFTPVPPKALRSPGPLVYVFVTLTPAPHPSPSPPVPPKALRSSGLQVEDPKFSEFLPFSLPLTPCPSLPLAPVPRKALRSSGLLVEAPKFSKFLLFSSPPPLLLTPAPHALPSPQGTALLRPVS